MDDSYKTLVSIASICIIYQFGWPALKFISKIILFVPLALGRLLSDLLSLNLLKDIFDIIICII